MILRLVIFLSVLALTAFSQVPPIEPGVSQELAKWRAARYSDVRYKLNLTLEKMSPVLKGTIEIRLRVGETGRKGDGETKAETRPVGSVPPIVLDWRKIRGHEQKSTISNVTINGRIALFDRPQHVKDGISRYYAEIDEHLVFYDNVVVPGENVIKLDFTSPILTSGSAITRYVDKEDGSEYIYSLFVPSDASTAFPVFDQPDLKARFSLTINTSTDWKAVSNTSSKLTDIALAGKPYSTHELPSDQNGPASKATFGWHFPETKPISTYVFAFAAGPFSQFEYQSGDMMKSVDESYFKRPQGPGAFTMNVFVRKSQSEKFKPHAAEVFRLNREAVKYFEQYFDYKFPFPKYDLVLIPEFPFGGMEHAGATFLRESSIIFPQEPTKNDLVSRATLIFHEAAHQWFGDTVTMSWFDDLWLKEGFATFTAYKAMEKIMPEMNAWKVFYERIKQGAYQTDSTKGTTPIYQEIKNLSAAKSAYGNIVYNKAPAFLRQAEFYLGEEKFQTAVRAFLKKHEFGNAGWEDLVKQFEGVSDKKLQKWAKQWVMIEGLPIVRTTKLNGGNGCFSFEIKQSTVRNEVGKWEMALKPLIRFSGDKIWDHRFDLGEGTFGEGICDAIVNPNPLLFIPNYQDYGYGIFLLDDKSRDYVLTNIQNEKDAFLRSMMWGSLWDSVREGELDPREYVELVVKVLSKSDGFSRSSPAQGTPKGVTLTEDESTVALLLGRIGTAMNYYLSEPPAVAGGLTQKSGGKPAFQTATSGVDLRDRVENLLSERMRHAETMGQRITYYRAFLNVAQSENARKMLREMLAAAESTTPAAKPATPPIQEGSLKSIPLKTKDKFDIVTRLLILNDPEAPKLLADLEKAETSDDAKRYAYAARAGIPTAENKAKFWNDFTNNKEISESWIEAAFGPWNSIRHADLTLPYLQRALQELPNHKRNRKIFFVNGWLGAFIGGQRSEEALNIVNKFLADNPNLDKDLRLKILENLDFIERAVKIRGKFKN